MLTHRGAQHRRISKLQRSKQYRENRAWVRALIAIAEAKALTMNKPELLQGSPHG